MGRDLYPSKAGCCEGDWGGGWLLLPSYQSKFIPRIMCSEGYDFNGYLLCQLINTPHLCLCPRRNTAERRTQQWTVMVTLLLSNYCHYNNTLRLHYCTLPILFQVGCVLHAARIMDLHNFYCISWNVNTLHFSCPPQDLPVSYSHH